MDGFEKDSSRGGFVQAVEVLAQFPGQEGRDVVVGQGLDRHWYEPSPHGHGGRPLLLSPSLGSEVVLGEQGHHRIGPVESEVHLLYEVVPGAPIPPVQLDLVTGPLELPAGPLCPGPVRARITDEEPHGVGHR